MLETQSRALETRIGT